MHVLSAQTVQDIKDFGDLVDHIWPLIIGLGALVEATRRFLKKQRRQLMADIEHNLKKELEPVAANLQRNGGSSAMDELHSKLDDIQSVQAERLKYEADGRLFMAATSQKLDQLATDLDITEAEVKLMTAATMIPVYRVDPEVNLVFVNQAYVELFEYASEEEAMLGDWMDRIAPEDRIKMKRGEAFAKHLPWMATYTVVGKTTGKRTQVTARAEPLWVNDNGPEDGRTFIGWHGTIRKVR